MKVSRNITSLLAISILSTSLLTSLSYAAENGKKHQRGPNIERLAEKLALNDEQKTTFTEIMSVQVDKKKAIATELREEKQIKMQAHKQETLAALASVLTEEQLNTMQEMMERKKGHKRDKERERS